MKNAFAFLGIGLLIIIGATYFLTNQNSVSENNDTTPLENNSTSSMLTLTSSAFTHNGLIPSVYTCDGPNTNPELSIANVPEGTVSLALIMEDPDIPQEVRESLGVDIIDHWVVFNMPATTRTIDASSAPPGIVGMGLRQRGYMGPCPPDREHRYFFKLFALGSMLDLPETATKKDVLEVMKDHILEETELIGRYNRVPGAQ